MAFPQNPVSILINVGIQAAQSASAGASTLFTGTSIVNQSNYAAQVSISSATFNAACAVAFSSAGGSLT